MTDSDKAKSIKARLLNMADGNNKKYQQLIVRFFHERLLFRLSKSEYRERFILKGGALLYAFEEFIPRPTLDIDFMGHRINNDKANVLTAFKNIASMSYPEDGITFHTDTLTADDITVEKTYPGVRIGMVANIGSYKQNLTFDIGFGDVIVPRPQELEYPTLFDAMEEPDILAYSLETVVAEKFQTMIDRGRFNSRMKDYFDLYRIISVHQFDNTLLSEAIKATFENRGTEFVEGHDFFSEDFTEDTMLNRQWKNYIRKMKLDLPSFPEIHNSITQWLMPYWRKLKKE
jgi:hypothetical protein bfra3_18232